MQYIKYKQQLTFIAACLLVLLTACSSTPSNVAEQTPAEQSKKQTAETATNEKGPAPPGLDTSAPDENPYLSQAREAPAAARNIFSRAVNAMQDAQWRDAEILLQQLTVEYPDLSGPYLNLGIVYRHLGEPDQAKQSFSNAFTVNKLNLEAYNQLALLEREEGAFAAAERHYLAALKAWPKHATSHKNIGILYDLYMGDLEKALQHFEIYQYLQDEPDRQVRGWIIDLNRRIAGAQS